MTSERIPIDMTPPTIFWKNIVRGASYTVVESFYELLDNALDDATDAQRRGDDIVTCRISLSLSQCSIKDNAIGMDAVKLGRGMTPGLSDKTTGEYKDISIGQYGKALKVAPFIIGKKYVVTTGVEGSTSTQSVEFDIEKFESWTGKYITINHNSKKPEEHGTKITIVDINQEKINSKSLTRIISHMRRDFGRRYRKPIRENRMRIFVNNMPVQPEEIPWEREYPIQDTVKSKFGPIDCEYGLVKLERGTARGIDLLYKGRVIEEGTTFGTDNQGMSARIRGTIDCNFVRISDDKLRVLRETNEYSEIEHAVKTSPKFKEFIDIVRNVSKVGHQPQPKNVERVVDEIFKRISAGIQTPEFLDHLMRAGINVGKQHVDAVRADVKDGHVGSLNYYGKNKSNDTEKRTRKPNVEPKKEKILGLIKLQDGSKMYTIRYNNRSFNIIPRYVDLDDPTTRFTREYADSALIVNHNIKNNYYLNCHTDDARGMYIASNNIDAMIDEWALGSNLTYKQAIEIRDAIYGV